MISCLLIHVSRNPQGLPVRKESSIAGESILIGRSAPCEIHLPDHRVNLLHAAIKRSADGTLYIEADKDAAIIINGFVEQSAALSTGARVEIGPYLLVVEPAPDGSDIALSVELVHPLPDAAKAYRTAPVTLADLGLSKRRLGYGLAAGILFVFLLLPLLPSTSTTFDKWQATLPITLTASWNPEPLTGGHGTFGAKCSICHQRALRAVSDDACKACHKQVARHLEAKLWADVNLHAEPFKDVRCTDCHQDHKGQAGLTLFDSSKCVACHGNIKSKYAATDLAKVRDFGTDHPQFHLTFWDGRELVRVRQDKKEQLAEEPRIKLNHQVHLSKKGLLTPNGNVVLVCADCHKIEDSGVHFEPMTMKQTCQQSQCHVEYFTEPVEELVPHGPERDVVNRLRELYAKWLLDSPAESKGACGHGSGAGAGKHILDCVNDLARKNAAAFFKEKVECGECHEIEPSGNKDVPWKIAPLHITRNYQPGAVFPHSKHSTIDCTECHNKVNSKLSAEIAMPGIEKCRECHAGRRPVKGKIRSTCESCHRFHRGES